MSELRQRTNAANSSIYEPDSALSSSTSQNDSKTETTDAPKMSNAVIRTLSGTLIIMLVGTCFYSGPTWIVLMIVSCQIVSFKEIIDIGYRIYKIYELPRFRTLTWYALVTMNYYFYGELIQEHLGVFKRSEMMQFFLDKHKLISYGMTIFGFGMFISSLRKGFYAKQFFFFGWTLVSLMIIVASSHCIIMNIMNGIIWLVLPSIFVAMNDIMAYFVGKFWPFGKKHPLTQLSPKKTWEGFIGGAICTMTTAWFMGSIFSKQPYLICPVEVDEQLGFVVRTDCTQDTIYDVVDMLTLPPFLQSLTGRTVLKMRMFQFHCFWIAAFASICAPWGGFFASGLKRAFKIKDFGDIIPGHGGFLDRFDCHLAISGFVWVYITTFIRKPTVGKVLGMYARLPEDDKLSLVSHIISNMDESQLGALKGF